MDFDLTDEQRLIKETAREFTDNEIVVAVARKRAQPPFRRRPGEEDRRPGLSRRDRPAGVRRRGTGLLQLRADRRGDRPRRLGDPHGHLGADVAGVLGHRQVRHRGAEAEVPAEAVLGRVARLLRADRARHRLRRRQPEDARAQDRLRLGDQRREDVDLDGQLREGRADLRPDRPGARAQGDRVLSRRHRPARLTPHRRSSTRWGCTRPTPGRSRSKTSRCQTRTCSAKVGDGFKIAMSNLDSGRYSVAAGCVGICQGCVEESVSYAKEREQFGRPIASFQLVQAMIADMVLKTDASRMLVWRAGWLKDQGRPNTLETSIAKLHATEASLECANIAIQVHGGAGYVDDHPVERYFRDARVTTLYEGTSQIQKLIIGRAMTGVNALVPPERAGRGSMSASAAYDGEAGSPARATARHRRARRRHDGLRDRPAGGPLGSPNAAARPRPRGPRAWDRAGRDGLTKEAAKGRLSAEEADAAAERLGPVDALDALAAVRAGDRGRARAPGAQARALSAAVGDRQRGVRAGDATPPRCW